MGFMDELRKLTQPYDDDNDFYEGADSSLREAPPPSAAQREFENVFGNEPAGKPEPEERQPAPREGSEGGLFGGLTRKQKKPQRERVLSRAMLRPETKRMAALVIAIMRDAGTPLPETSPMAKASLLSLRVKS